MNVEEREAFWQFWVSRTDIADIPIVAAEMGFIAGMSHRDKRVAELEAVVATQAKMIQALRDCEAAEAARRK